MVAHSCYERRHAIRVDEFQEMENTDNLQRSDVRFARSCQRPFGAASRSVTLAAWFVRLNACGRVSARLVSRCPKLQYSDLGSVRSFTSSPWRHVILRDCPAISTDQALRCWLGLSLRNICRAQLRSESREPCAIPQPKYGSRSADDAHERAYAALHSFATDRHVLRQVSLQQRA
jgi:hypothetical protein